VKVIEVSIFSTIQLGENHQVSCCFVIGFLQGTIPGVDEEEDPLSDSRVLLVGKSIF